MRSENRCGTANSRSLQRQRLEIEPEAGEHEAIEAVALDIGGNHGAVGDDRRIAGNERVLQLDGVGACQIANVDAIGAGRGKLGERTAHEGDRGNNAIGHVLPYVLLAGDVGRVPFYFCHS